SDTEGLSEFSEPLIMDTYAHLERSLVVNFYKDNLLPHRIKALMSEGHRYAYILFDGERAGFLSYYLEEETFFIDKLYLRTAFQRKGIGTATIDALVRMAKDEGCIKVELVANETNTPAINLYTKMGFVVTEHVKRYCSPTMNMVKTLH
ncbi:MAG: GNAT family N-acetyltransferase, partial [archaeon]|nr:GNAT family N-acetyltransferase [archaeon]